MFSPPQEIVSQASLPSTSYHIAREGYSVAYDPRTRNPIYVYEKLSSDCLNGRVSRDGCNFKEDRLIPGIFRSTIKDYQGSGYDRGHLACAGNHQDNLKDMEDTFYLSNMSPQNKNFNRGYWNKLEKHVRDLTKEHKMVEVFTGTLYLPKEVNGVKIVSYEVIGENNVAVPTHFFKVIRYKNKNESLETIAYVLPNETIAPGTPLNQFNATVHSLEKAAGVIFYSDPQ